MIYDKIMKNGSFVCIVQSIAVSMSKNFHANQLNWVHDQHQH